MEDPQLILEQNIQDMKDKVPEMNENIAMIKANVTLLEKELNRLQDQEKDLIAKTKAAINQERDDLAASYATNLEQVRSSKSRTQGQLETSKKAYDKALKVKQSYMQEIERKSKQAMHAIQEAKRAKWQREVADVMEEFDVAGIDQSHDEMVDRIEQESANSEARLDMALSKSDNDEQEVEEEAEKIKAEEIVKQFKIEMGMSGSSQQEQQSQRQNN